MTESIIGLLSGLLGFVPAAGSAQREPVEPEPTAEATREVLKGNAFQRHS